MRKIIIAGNWKLNKTIRESIELVEALKKEIANVTEVDVVVCPVYTSIAGVRDSVKGTNIGLGAQDCYWEDAGAFTGEVSAALLKDAGVQFVVIGHSERRQFFGETDDTVNKRIRAALKQGMTPIACVGELLQEREAGKTFEVIKKQCLGSFAGFTADEIKKVIIAYEPVWAIGTGKTATPEQAQEVHAYIRKLLGDMAGKETADVIRIQYGGSVKADNAAELMSQKDIDGALVGGASLKADSFSAIVKNSIVKK